MREREKVVFVTVHWTWSLDFGVKFVTNRQAVILSKTFVMVDRWQERLIICFNTNMISVIGLF